MIIVYRQIESITIPWEYTQHQVKHEEGADDDEGDVVHPVPGTSLHIITLQETDNIITLTAGIISQKFLKSW